MYPVIDVDELVLWEVREEVLVIDQPYDPFFYPYYWGGPYGAYYPYYGHHYPMHSRTYVRSRQLLPDPAAVLPRLAELAAADPASAACLARLAPAHRTFAFQTAEEFLSYALDEA